MPTELPTDDTQLVAWMAFAQAAAKTWRHVEAESVLIRDSGYLADGCSDPAEHNRLMEAEGEAWAAYRQAGGT
jgi:hypothetical protein